MRFTQKELLSAVEGINTCFEVTEEGAATLAEVADTLQYHIECRVGTNEESQAIKNLEIFEEFYNLTDYQMCAEGTTKLVDILWSAIKTCKYDNGKPLVTEDNNFFDHFDRDPYEIFEDLYFVEAQLKGNHIEFLCAYSEQEFKNEVISMYDGADYEHDCGDDDSFSMSDAFTELNRINK